MRPCLTGTRSGSRVVFCSSSSATGSGRSAATRHPEWLEGGTRSRVSRPLAWRSSRLGCATFFAAPTASVTVIWSTSCSVPFLPRARPEQGHHLIRGITGHHSHHRTFGKRLFIRTEAWSLRQRSPREFVKAVERVVHRHLPNLREACLAGQL